MLRLPFLQDWEGVPGWGLTLAHLSSLICFFASLFCPPQQDDTEAAGAKAATGEQKREVEVAASLGSSQAWKLVFQERAVCCRGQIAPYS